MKTIMKIVSLLALILSLECNAQQPGDSKPLASTHSFKAYRELAHERKVLRRERRLLKQNERHARHRQKDTYSLKFGVHRKKKHKNKEKKGTATLGDTQSVNK